MEVVSPLTFEAANNKRRIRSPIHDATNCAADEDVTMDCESYPAKRRRKNDFNGEANGTIAGGWMSPFAMAAGGGFGKRSRSRSPPHSPHNSKLQDLQSTIASQASELSTLKTQHSAALTSNNELSAQNVQLTNENKILKKAVGIQSERQSHLTNELEQVRRVNEEALERIRQLEQMNLTLRYQLEAAGRGGNEFMGFGPRPPDVY